MKDAIPEERNRNGAYLNIISFIERTNITYDDMSHLIFVGAFRSFNQPKGQLIIEAKKYFNREKKEVSPDTLFQVAPKSFSFPTMDKDILEDAFDELEGLGYPVSISPFDLLKTSFRGDVMVKELPSYLNKVVRMVGYLVSIKDVPIKKTGNRK
jgi:error-prone DNA polymerase